MQNINQQILKKGYLLIPKSLLEQLINSDTLSEGELEAFLKILVKANFSETSHNDHWNLNLPCKRGESMHSYREWSNIFHWSMGKAYRFIKQLSKDGLIEIIPHENMSTLHIRIVNYEMWVGSSDSSLKKKRTVNEKFHIFWDKFHEVTLLHKENIAKAQREWKKLSEKEQQLAIDRIEDYYYHLTNINFVLHACSYLSNKAFLNEYTN